jgi:ribosomal protein S12 methylthiotransferase
MPTARVITLGCAKNEVDSEDIAGVLAESGYTLDSRAHHADLVVINTCGFLEAAKQESLAVIRKAVRSKGRAKVVVAGCLVQRMGDQIAQLAPGADAYVGVGQMSRIGEIARRCAARAGAGDQPLVDAPPPYHRWADVPTRLRSGTPWSAYLKVSEGCDHRCTFCTIPSFRGPHRSKPIERVLAEARHLAAQGAVEINLIAQDVTQYGFDLYREYTLPKLLRKLHEVDGVEWIRLLYLYPSRVTDELIEALATLPKMVHYVDMPLQHAHPEVLRRMRRPWDGERYLRLFERLRVAMPDCAIRSTFIVGFPGETEEEFSFLLQFLREAKLDRMGAFQYSREFGTPSFDMPGQVPAKVRARRYDRLMGVQQAISLERGRRWIGQSMLVLAESPRDDWTICRSHRDAPEIDGVVFVEGKLAPGTFHRVQVAAATEYDLYATPDGVGGSASRKRLTPLRLSAPSSPR